jgi:hypothetical protein
MRKILAVVACCLGVSACDTLTYTPSEYPLREGVIRPLQVAGTVDITNAQPSTDRVIVYSYAGSKLGSNLRAITDVMMRQAQRELQKNATVKDTAARKSISLKVTSLRSEYIAFFWKSNVEFQATLGDGQVLQFKVPHTSGVLLQDLNGCIAEGVMTLLNDERLRTYLAS